MSKQAKIAAVEKIINYTFIDKDILWNALSAPGSFGTVGDGNRVPAMLGDAILKTIVLMTHVRTSTTCISITAPVENIIGNVNLARVFDILLLGPHVNGNQSQGANHGIKTKTATVEAIIAAVYIDSGENMDRARSVMTAMGWHVPATTG